MLNFVRLSVKLWCNGKKMVLGTDYTQLPRHFMSVQVPNWHIQTVAFHNPRHYTSVRRNSCKVCDHQSM